MKFQKTSLLALSALIMAVTATPTFSQSSSNENISFRCNKSNPQTTTIYNSEKDKEVALIHWKTEYIDAKDISKSCDDAANKLNESFQKEEEQIFALESNSQNQLVFCLVNQQGDSCNLKTSHELFRIKASVESEQIKTILSEIVDSKFTNINPEDAIRTGGGRSYTKITRKKWLGIF